MPSTRKFTPDDLSIGLGACLNPVLVEAMELDQSAVERLKATHATRFRIHDDMQAATNVADLRRLAQEHDDLEFVQQEIWGFDKNPNFHRWYSVPQCSCPKGMNEILTGTGRRRVAPGCLIHGGGWMPKPAVQTPAAEQP